MNPDPAVSASYRGRLEELQRSPRDEATLQSLARFRQELLAAAPPSGRAAIAAEKLELLQRYLTVTPIRLPDDAPAGLRAVAEALAGCLWSAALVQSIEQQLNALTAEHADARARTRTLHAELHVLEQRRDVLRGYVRLLDGLTGSGA